MKKCACTSVTIPRKVVVVGYIALFNIVIVDRRREMILLFPGSADPTSTLRTNPGSRKSNNHGQSRTCYESSKSRGYSTCVYFNSDISLGVLTCEGNSGSMRTTL